MSDWFDEGTEGGDDADTGDWFAQETEAQETETRTPTAKPGAETPAPGGTYNMFGQSRDVPEDVDPGPFGAAADALAGTPEALATVATASAAEPVAGIAGLATGLVNQDADAAAAAVDATRDVMTYQPRSEQGMDTLHMIGSFLSPIASAFETAESYLGDATFDMTGSPEMAAIATAMPAGVAEILGLGMGRKPSQAAQAARRIREEVEGGAAVEDAVDAMTPERSPESIVQSLRNEKTRDLVQDVKPNSEIVEAAKTYNIDLDPSHYSTNESFIKVIQALKSQPDNPLAAKEAKALQDLGNRADELINEMGGYTDRGMLETSLRDRLDNDRSNIQMAEDEQFRLVDERIPAKTRVEAPASRAYIENRLEEVGGNPQLLTTAERALMGVVLGVDDPKKARTLTYGAIDTIRRDIGSGYKNQGPFKDDDAATLDQVYGVLAQDQQKMADFAEVGDRYRAAMDLTIRRKELEKAMTKMYGKELEGSFIKQLTTGIGQLGKGDAAKFKQTMNMIPADMRQTAAATMLHDLFVAGKINRGDSFGLGFANVYNTLERNPTIKEELFRYLPEESQKMFDGIGKISQGIAKAQLYANTSKTANALLAALEDGTMVQKIMSSATETGLRIKGWQLMGHYGAATADNISKNMKRMNKRVDAATELMASPQFSAAVDKAIEGKEKTANMLLKRSKAWQKFRDTLGEGTRRQLLAIGPIAWLTQQPQQEEAPQDVQ